MTLDLGPGAILDGVKIGSVAKDAGVGVDTLRYYERRGLLAKPTRRGSGYREYPPETAQLVRFIKRAQGLGFTLEEVGELLRLREGGNRVRARALAEEKVGEIDEKLSRLTAMRRALSGLVSACSCNSGRAPKCPIIEALEEPGAELNGRFRERGTGRS